MFKSHMGSTRLNIAPPSLQKQTKNPSEHGLKISKDQQENFFPKGSTSEIYLGA